MTTNLPVGAMRRVGRGFFQFSRGPDGGIVLYHVIGRRSQVSPRLGLWTRFGAPFISETPPT